MLKLLKLIFCNIIETSLVAKLKSVNENTRYQINILILLPESAQWYSINAYMSLFFYHCVWCK